MLESWDEIVVQRFVDGREVNVGIIGNTVLPIAEIDFGAMPDGKWKIITYQSKWETGSDEDLGAVPMYAVDDIEVAVAAVRTAGGRADDVEQQSFGRSVLCRDDQGLLFWLAQLD